MSGKPFRCSALLELFGHRAVAADNSSALHNEARRFHDTLRSALHESSYPDTYCTVLLDKCILSADNPDAILDIIVRVRRSLLRLDGPLLLRGVVLPREASVLLNKKPVRKNDPLPGIVLDSGAWQLFGQVEAFKGIGIWIDEAFLKRADVNVMANYYVADQRSHVYSRFYDLPFTNDDLGYQETMNLVGLLREAYHDSRKVARFFIPLLINWVAHMELSIEPNPNSTDMKGCGLDYSIIHDKAFEHLRLIPGSELVLAKLMERLYPGTEAISSHRVHHRRWVSLNKHLINKCGWFQAILQADDKGTRIPNEIAGRGKRRAFAQALAGKGLPDLDEAVE